jgi:hypothetical protein
MQNFLDNKKTYITAVLCGLAVILYKTGILPYETLVWLLGLGGPMGLVFLRLAVAKASNAAETVEFVINQYNQLNDKYEKIKKDLALTPSVKRVLKADADTSTVVPKT